VRRYFRTAGLSAALNVMRTAIHGESQLQSMPNNTTIMISFAACFALSLSAYTAGGSALAPSVRRLIDEAAGVLERIGTVTEHRNGLSMLYGKHLRQIVRRAARGGGRSRGPGGSIGGGGGGLLGAAPGGGPPTGSSNASVATMGTPAAAASATSISATAHAPAVEQQMMWPETLPFSTMSDDQIMHVLNQPGNEFEPSFGGLSWDDMSNFDWLHWPEFSS
jgi:hypothetical protein